MPVKGERSRRRARGAERRARTPHAANARKRLSLCTVVYPTPCPRHRQSASSVDACPKAMKLSLCALWAWGPGGARLGRQTLSRSGVALMSHSPSGSPGGTCLGL